MARSAIFLIFVVVAVALQVADCKSAAPPKCASNEVYSPCRKFHDAACSGSYERKSNTGKCTPGCECPDGFCRNSFKECIDTKEIRVNPIYKKP